MRMRSFMFDMVRSELEDAVGRDNVSTSAAERETYSVDYFWVGRMWQDKGEYKVQSVEAAQQEDGTVTVTVRGGYPSLNYMALNAVYTMRPKPVSSVSAT